MKINYRQMSICLFMSFVVVKLLALPGWMYVESGNMSWFVTLVMMTIDLLFAILIVDLMSKSGSKNILEFMDMTVGKVLSRIFLVMLGLKYLLVLANIGKGLELFVIENLYEEFNWNLYGIPLLIVSSYMVYKGIRNISRVMEFFYVPIIAGCVYIAFKSVMGLDFGGLLPLFEQGARPLFNSAYIHAGYFGSSVFVFMLFGDVDLKKGKTKNFVVFISIAIILVVGIMVIYYAQFGVTCPMHQFALSDVSQFNSNRSSVGELSWLIVSLWIVAQVVTFSMFGYCFSRVVQLLFKTKSVQPGVIILALYIVAWGYITAKVNHSEYLFISPIASWLTFITGYALPLILSVGFVVRDKKIKRGKYEKNKNHI